MGVDDASFTMQLLDELTAPGRDMGAVLAALKSALGEAGSAAGDAGDALKGAGRDAAKAAEAMESAFKGMDAAMAHQNWVKMKRGQVETGKLNAEFKKMDDAMAHQKWVGLKRAEVQSNKAAFAAKQHADGLQRVAALGTPLDKLALGPMAAVAKAGAVAATALAAVAGVIVVKFGAAAIHMAAFAQKSILALTQLTGNAGTAAREFDEVRKISGRFGLDVEETQKSFQKLLAAQFSIGQAKDLIKMGADLQVVTGEAESAQRALLTLSQIKAKGKLQGEELMQLQEAGVSQGLILEALEKALGKDRAEVQKMLSGGKIDAETGVAAIIEAIKHKVGEHELGEAGAKFADTTLAGFQGRMKAGMQNAMIDIGTRIEPAIVRITQLIQGSIDRLVKSGKLQALGDAFVRGFERFAGFIESNWPAIESAIVFTIEAIIGGVNMAISALMFMSDNWSTIMTIMKGVGIVLGVVAAGAVLMFAPFLLTAAAIMAVGVAIAFAVGWLVGKLIPAVTAFGSAWLATVQGVIAPFKAAFDTIAAIFDSTGMSWSEKLFAIGQAIITGLVNGITAMMMAPVNLVRNIGQRIVGAFTGELQTHSPSKIFVEAGIDTIGGFPIGVDKEAAKAIASVTGVATDISSAFTGALAIHTPANDVTASPVAAALGVEAPTLQGANAQAASAAAQSVAAPAGEGGTSGGPISVTVQVSGADVSNPEQLGQTIGVAVRRELVALLKKAS
ncbi:MAG TPA: tape measure protein [Polyangiaceae bacterium]|nr:tape measure protein [Polyangiaceae bacterium]